MSIRDRMSNHFTLFLRAAPVRQVVEAIQARKTGFYIALQDGDQFSITTLPVLRSQLIALANDFGTATLTLSLDKVEGLWAPRAAVAPDADDQVVMSRLSLGESLPVVENGNLVGVVARPTRAIGSSTLGSMYGPRFALFGDEKPQAGTVAPPIRICPNCGKTIDFYRPRHVGNTVERHCPNCDSLITERQP